MKIQGATLLSIELAPFLEEDTEILDLTQRLFGYV